METDEPAAERAGPGLLKTNQHEEVRPCYGGDDHGRCCVGRGGVGVEDSSRGKCLHASLSLAREAAAG